MKKIRKERTIAEKIEFLTEAMDRYGIPFTINRNPTPEEIAEIKKGFKIKDNILEEIQNRMKE